MNLPVQQLQQALEQLEPAAKPLQICIAFSGGLDSRVLLEAAWQLQQQNPNDLQLRALHINHQLSDQADAWADFCRRCCEQKQLPLTIHPVQPNDYPGSSLEARARQARYQVFAEQLQEGEYLLQAHHRKDQAETLLLRLLRAAGTLGLSSIPRQRPLGRGQLLRPFLHLSREDLELAAHEQQLQWVEDDSNQSNRFDRNFIRLQVLPLLQERFPACEENLAEVARLATQSNQLNRDLAELDRQHLQPSTSAALPVQALLQLPKYRQINLLRHWLLDRGLTPPGKHLWAELQKLLQARQDAQPQLSWGDSQARIQARRHQDQLFIQPEKAFAPLPANWQLDWDNRSPLETPCGCFDFQLRQQASDNLPKTLRVTARQGGEKIRLPRRGSRDVKRLLQESGLPPWQRQQLPFIWQGEELIAVGSLLIAEGWEAL
ncbi:tRNA lysidine(34) synthetase TilS [Marinospirillum perlucidum]|uniref:tRNA lysidine(34) synthetase TilS n=1 Tax=Marinospirillum perlucidum TaxID=1982602 RepID=UPI000DF3CB2C|nr:tRNA lysidine(34) synthetase TilS [Marinospirillum perlucidum]